MFTISFLCLDFKIFLASFNLQISFLVKVEEVASMVENNTEVGSLTLRNVSLGDDGVKQLTTVLKSSENVKVGY